MMKKVVFMGTPDFAVPVLESLIDAPNVQVVLVVTQPDRPVGRRQKLTPPPVKKVAEKHGIPVYQPEKMQVEYGEVLTYEPDIIITAAYGQLLPKQLLDAPEYGCINVHASLLPQLRGGAPIHYAILEGKKETGITIMYMAEKLDAGDIISWEKLPINMSDHVGILHDKLAEIGADLLLKTLPVIFTKTNERIEQNEAEATYAPNITRELEKINWHETQERVYNHIRGLHPWPVAYTTFQDERMKIWWSEMDEQTYEGEVGEIVSVTDEYFTVVCGDGKGIRITDIQLAGRKRMLVKDFLRGNKDAIQIGQKVV